MENRKEIRELSLYFAEALEEFVKVGDDNALAKLMDAKVKLGDYGVQVKQLCDNAKEIKYAIIFERKTIAEIKVHKNNY